MRPTTKPNPLLELSITLIVPSVILIQLSDPGRLGTVNALLLALAFPLSLGLWTLLRERRVTLFAVLGIVGILLTGGIGLLRLDPQWLAFKEAAIPALIGLAVLASTRTRYALIRTLLYNPALVKVDRIQVVLESRGNAAAFGKRLLNANYFLAGTFFFSAAMNYVLATWLVTSPAGSAAFNAELGRLTLLSYPVIAVPSMVMILIIFYSLWRTTHALTGLGLEEVLVAHGSGRSRDKQA
jgi:intracellular septation protein A